MEQSLPHPHLDRTMRPIGPSAIDKVMYVIVRKRWLRFSCSLFLNITCHIFTTVMCMKSLLSSKTRYNVEKMAFSGKSQETFTCYAATISNSDHKTIVYSNMYWFTVIKLTNFSLLIICIFCNKCKLKTSKNMQKTISITTN